MDRKKDPFEQLAQGPSAKFENTRPEKVDSQYARKGSTGWAD
jgi:hypothetical protein